MDDLPPEMRPAGADRGVDDPQGTPVGRDAPPTMPSRRAFLLCFASVVVAGLFGAVIGYGLVDLGCSGDCEGEALLGGLIGAVTGALGVGVVAVLVLRAMGEWHSRASRP